MKSHHSVNGWLSDPPLLILGGERSLRRGDVGTVTGRADEGDEVKLQALDDPDLQGVWVSGGN